MGDGEALPTAAVRAIYADNLVPVVAVHEAGLVALETLPDELDSLVEGNLLNRYRYFINAVALQYLGSGLVGVTTSHDETLPSRRRVRPKSQTLGRARHNLGAPRCAGRAAQ